jgi:Xaa-Pro aminopeptidase
MDITTYRVRSFPMLLLSVLLLGCHDSGTAPVEEAFPSKLYPYEVTYDAVSFKQRRDELLQRMAAGSIAVVTTNSTYLRNGDVNYDFRPASVFYYLTGFEEPNAVAVIRKKAGPVNASELIMFVEGREGSAVQWLGPVYGPDGAVTYFGADSGYIIGTFPQMLRAYLSSGSVQRVYANLDDNATIGNIFINAGGSSYPVTSIDSIADDMRTVKNTLELGLLRRAIEVSTQAFREGIQAIKPSMYEYEVEAVFNLVLRLNGCPRTSFPSIVASGPNITIIHYDLNKRKMADGDLVMIDFGAEYGFYAADITRTVPVNGRFNEEQAAIYDVVSKSLDAVIAAAAPGVSYNSLSSMNVDIIIGGLLEKGVITGSKSEIIASGRYRLYIPAGLGHMIGLDVHDPWPSIPGQQRILRENMVLAIEPHVYLSADDLTVTPRFRGVCARIEDDIRVTGSGCEVLSASLPRTRGELEGLMRR